MAYFCCGTAGITPSFFGFIMRKLLFTFYEPDQKIMIQELTKWIIVLFCIGISALFSWGLKEWRLAEVGAKV